jgi:hypothetical protein
MQIYPSALATNLRVSTILGGSSYAKNLIRSSKQRRNKKHNNGVTVSIEQKDHEETLDSVGLKESSLNYGRSIF